jgi:hypothetical protein
VEGVLWWWRLRIILDGSRSAARATLEWRVLQPERGVWIPLSAPPRLSLKGALWDLVFFGSNRCADRDAPREVYALLLWISPWLTETCARCSGIRDRISSSFAYSLNHPVSSLLGELDSLFRQNNSLFCWSRESAP